MYWYDTDVAIACAIEAVLHWTFHCDDASCCVTVLHVGCECQMEFSVGT